MPLTDNSYYVAQLNIPNVVDSPAVASAVANTTRRLEKEFMREVLGNQLYNSFMVALGMLPDGSFLYVQNGAATMNGAPIAIPNITTTGEVTLIAGTTQGFAVGTSYYIAPWLAGYGYSLELRGTGTLTEGIDYVDNVNGGFAFPNIILQNGQVLTIHLKSPPPIPTTLTSPTQKWINLLNGVDYMGMDGLQKHFAGFIDLRNVYENVGVKISPIANLVYYWYCVEHWQDMIKNTGYPSAMLNQNMARQYNTVYDFLEQLRDFMYSIDVVTPIQMVYTGWNPIVLDRAMEKYSYSNTNGL